MDNKNGVADGSVGVSSSLGTTGPVGVAEGLEGVANGQGVVSPVGVALFGMGRAGQYHLPRLAAAAGVAVRWVVDVAGGRDAALGLAERHGLHTAAFLPADHCQQAFDDASTHAVVITTPTQSHEALIKRALAAGKHVFCEKPIAFTADVVRSCYQEAEKQGRVLFCAFNRRFDPQHMAVREAVQCGRLGAVRAVHYTARDAITTPDYVSRYISHSGGIFCDSVIHQLDFVLWLLGARPCSLYALGSRSSLRAQEFSDCGDVDTAIVTLAFPAGVTATIEVMREAQTDFSYFRLEVVGSADTVLLHKTTETTLARLDMSGGGTDTRERFTFATSHGTEMDCFLDVIRGRKKCPVLPEEVILASELADLCMTSLKEKRVIHL